MGGKGSKPKPNRAARKVERDIFLRWAKEHKLRADTIDSLLAADFDDFEALLEATDEDIRLIRPEIPIGQQVLLRKAINALRNDPSKLDNILKELNAAGVAESLYLKHEPRSEVLSEEEKYYTIPNLRAEVLTEEKKSDIATSTGYLSMHGDNTCDIYEKPDGDGDQYEACQDWQDIHTESVVKALYDFQARESEELCFQRDDELIILHKANKWWYARHKGTNRTGYIPSNYVVVAAGKNWWFDISRNEANEHLLMPGLRDGTFCVRNGSEAGTNVLSVRFLKSTSAQSFGIRHYKIQFERNEGKCYIAAQHTFTSIDNLIKYYQENAGLCCLLDKPCPRIPLTVPFLEMEVDKNSIEIFEQIGEGNFGTVHKGVWKDRVDVAVKVLKPNQMENAKMIEEARVMHRLRHRHLVQLMGICTTGEQFYIITELMEHGSLQEYLRKADQRKIDFNVLKSMAAQITEGMTYLEKHNFVHRDVRAANMLVGANNTVKVADFGLARLAGEAYISSGTKIPVKWTAPEAYKHLTFTVKSDVWSFGVLLFEIITYGEVPYPGIPNDKVQRMVQKGYRMPKPTTYLCPEDINKKMLQCWHPEAEERPSFADLNAFFAKYKLKKSDIPAGGYYNVPEKIDDEIDEDYDGYICVNYERKVKV